MAKANYVGANRGDIQYIPPPSSAMSASPQTGYAQPAQFIRQDQIHTVDAAGNPAPNYEKTNFDHVGNVQSRESFVKDEQKPKRRNVIARLWFHFWRHWIFYGILGVIFLAIFLPIFFLVIFPAIAQRMVDDADLPIYNAQIMEPHPNSIVYSMNGSLAVPKPFSVRMEPVTLSLFIDEGLPQIKPYVEVGLFYPDGTTLKGNATVSIVDQKAEIKDPGEFVRFLESAVYNERFFLSARGQTTAWLGKLKAKLKLNKRVELKGLNMLKGFAINSARVVLPPEEDGTNFIGNITLPNASDVTFEMGNVTLNLKVAGLIVGHATILDVFLVPGNNSVTARGTANLRTIIGNLPLILAAEAQAISKGNIELQASGNKTVYNGESIYYFEDVLNDLELSAQMPILKLLLDSAGGLLGDLGGAGGLGGLLGGLSGGAAGQNLSETLKTKNITDLIPMILGPETGDNSNGNSSLLSLLGMRSLEASERMYHGFSKRLTQPKQLDVEVTLHKRSDAIARREAAAEAAAQTSKERLGRRVARQVKRIPHHENYDAIVKLMKSEKGNVASWLSETFDIPEAGSIASSVFDALLAGQSRKAQRAQIDARNSTVGLGPILEGAAGLVKRVPQHENYAEIVELLKSEKGNLASWLSETFEDPAAGSITESIFDALLAGQKRKREAFETEAVGVPIRRRQNVKPQSHNDVVAAILAKERAKRDPPGLALVRRVARDAVGGIAGNAVAAREAPPLHKRRNQKNHHEVVAAILSKREALDRFGEAVRGFGKKSIANLKPRDLEIAAPFSNLVEVAMRREDARRGPLDTRSDTPVVVKGRAFAKGELLGKFTLTVRGFVQRSRDVVQGRAVAAETIATPEPYKRKRSTKSGREIVDGILSRSEVFNRFGAAVSDFGNRDLSKLERRELNLEVPALAAIIENAKRHEDAKRAVVDTQNDAPILIKGKRFFPAELLGRFGTAVRSFTKTGMHTVVGGVVAAAHMPPPLHKRRNQKNHREVVAAILSKRDALDRFGAAVRRAGLKGIDNMKTRELLLDTSKLQAVKEMAKRREDQKRAVLDTWSDAPVVVKGRALAKGELLGRFALTVRGYAKAGMDIVQGRAVVAAAAPPPFEKRRNKKNHKEVVAAILTKREALDRFGSVVRGFGLKGINMLKTGELNMDTSKLQAVKEVAKRREDQRRAVLDTRSEAPVVVKGRAFQKFELLGRFALAVRGNVKCWLSLIQGHAVAAESHKTPHISEDGDEDLDYDEELEELEVKDEKTIPPIEELPNPLAAWSNIGALLQQRNTVSLLGNVAGLLAKSQGLSKRDLGEAEGNGGTEAAAAVALGLTDVHKVMPLLMTNAKALEAFGKLTANREIRETWAKLSESPEAQEIYRVFVKGRDEAERASELA